MIRVIGLFFLYAGTCFAAMGPVKTAKEDTLERLKKIEDAYYPALELKNDQEKIKAYELFKVLLTKSFADYPTTFDIAFRYSEQQPLHNAPSSVHHAHYSSIIKRLCNEIMQMAYQPNLEESAYDGVVGNCITSVAASRPRMSLIITGNNRDLTRAHIEEEFKRLSIRANNSVTPGEKIWHH